MVSNIFKITKKKWVPVLLAVLISGCQTTITTGGSPTPSPTATPTPGIKTETFEVLPDSKIENGTITSGNNYVFKYYAAVDPIPMAVDDEYTDTFIFEISKNEKDSFTYE